MIICDIKALRNEADVEQSFVRPLLKLLGYSDTAIIPKASLDALDVRGMRGQKQAKYRPDFALQVGSSLRFLIEAKAPSEDLDEHEWQPRGYAILLNGTPKGKIIDRYLLTNGLETRVYDPTLNKVERTFSFASVGASKSIEILKELIGPTANKINAPAASSEIRLKKLPLQQINQIFSWCHQLIYRKDHISQAQAFTEFVKLISLKLMSDREIKARFPAIITQDEIVVPSNEVNFSLDWLARHKAQAANPMSDIQFQKFMRDRESEIALGIRKRMFDTKEGIELNPDTIEGVVRKLEGVFLFGIDADLNGRLFETFLNATMRGKDLGQFFTPRSLIKLGVGLAQLQVRAAIPGGGFHTDTVVDACCGSGGFLIDALAEMWARADKLPLTNAEIAAEKHRIANEHIVGMDVANAPKLARIARLNMYLHGDGGAKIFHVNALDKDVADRPTDAPEVVAEKKELRKMLETAAFDVALTNPPFAKALDRTTEDEALILSQYEISKAKELKGGSVRSNLLFIERYRDILKPGGRLVTILDDGLLSGDDYGWFRNKLRLWFNIKAVVSLPGDAFQRSNARVKTSFVVAERRADDDQSAQAPIFMYACRYVGLDDPKRQRARAGDSDMRSSAKAEIETVLSEFKNFQEGKSDAYRFPAGDDSDRLDAKFRMFEPGRKVNAWSASGFDVGPMSNFMNPRAYAAGEFVPGDSEETVRVMVVRYTGAADEAEEVVPKDGSYGKLYPVKTGDIVISNIAASYGSIAVVPPELDGSVVSSEYTVLIANGQYDPKILQLILRSPEVRADILLSSSGANRTRTRWDLMKDVFIPYPNSDTLKEVRKQIAAGERARREADEAFALAQKTTEQNLNLRSSTATTVLEAFRPPK